ncbi:MAG: hypothetical protein GY851_29740 [bacterium]|nr:hypothetical protein [bacterium]
MKPKTKKPSSLLDEGKPAVQLNSHQFIVSIVILLVYSCILITLGIAIGRWQHSYEPKRLAQRETTPETADPISPPKPDEQAQGRTGSVPDPRGDDGEREGSQTFPRPDAVAQQRVPGGGEPDGFVAVPAPAPRGARTRPRNGMKPVPADDKPHSSSPKPAANTVAAAKPGQPDKPKPPKAATAIDAPETTDEPKTPSGGTGAPPKPRGEGQKPTETPKEGAEKPGTAAESSREPSKPSTGGEGVKPAETTTTKPSATTTAASGKGGYVVQVAAYALKNRSQAEKFRKGLESKTGVTAELAVSESEKLVRVWAGRSSDENTARVVRDKLRAHTEYAGCYVKKAN